MILLYTTSGVGLQDVRFISGKARSLVYTQLHVSIKQVKTNRVEKVLQVKVLGSDSPASVY